MANTVLARLKMEGDEDINKRLDAVGEHGQRAFKRIDQTIKDSGAGLSKFGSDLAKLTPSGGQAADAGSGLGTLLGGAGLGKLAGAAGPGSFLAGLGASISAALIAMAKLGEQTERTQERLKGLGGGAKALDQVRDSAKRLGTDPDKLAPAFEDFLKFRRGAEGSNPNVIRNPFVPQDDTGAGVQVFSGGQLTSGPIATNEKFLKAQEALIAQSKLDKTPTADAAQAVREFFKNVYQSKDTVGGGKAPGLDASGLRGLQDVSPAMANYVAQAVGPSLGRGFANADDLAKFLERSGRPISPSAIIGGIGGGGADKAIAQGNAKRGVTDSLEAVQAAVADVGKNGAGDHARLGPMLEDAAKFIDSRNRPPPPLPTLSELFGTYFNKNTPLPERPAYTPPVIPPPPAPAVPSAIPDQTSYTDGRRYSRQLNPEQTQAVASDVSDAGKDLAAAIRGAADAVRNSSPASSSSSSETDQKFAGGGGIDVTGGGHVNGPGTTTSDSIPAMLSDKEYVIKASSAKKIGRAYLDRLNAGHFAAGGSVVSWSRPSVGPAPVGNITLAPDGVGVIIDGNYYPPDSPVLSDPRIKYTVERLRNPQLDDDQEGDDQGNKEPPRGLRAGNYDITAAPDGGAVINGVYHGPNDPILNDPNVQAALEKSRRGGIDTRKKIRGTKSQFVGSHDRYDAANYQSEVDNPAYQPYATGGAVGNLPAGGGFAERLAAMGLGGTIDVPHLAIGGAADIGSLSAPPSMADIAPASGGGLGDLSDFGRVELADARGSYKVIAHRGVVGELRGAARDSANASTGSPSWKR